MEVFENITFRAVPAPVLAKACEKYLEWYKREGERRATRKAEKLTGLYAWFFQGILRMPYETHLMKVIADLKQAKPGYASMWECFCDFEPKDHWRVIGLYRLSRLTVPSKDIALGSDDAFILRDCLEPELDLDRFY